MKSFTIIYFYILITMYHISNETYYTQTTIPDQFNYPLDWIRFVNFAEKYDKSFSSKFDVEQRFSTFRQNWDRVIEHNANKTHTFTTEINQYSDSNFEYYKSETVVDLGKTSKYLRVQVQPQYCTPEPYDSSENIPEFMDWRFRGIISPVKNQGICGSCWAIAASGSIESALAIKTGNFISPLSTQQMLDCLPTYYDYGCGGGHFDVAFKNMIQTGWGLCLDSTYPYTSGKTGTTNMCMKLLCESKAHLSSCSTIESGNQLSLKAAVSKQPVAISLDASSWHFTHYSGGIISSSEFCGNAVQNHAALIIGYGTSSSFTEDGIYTFQKYWLIKNSWSTDWGDHGYVKIARSDDEKDVGVCGVAKHASFASIKN
jgi:C1A family cysteine protease